MKFVFSALILGAFCVLAGNASAYEARVDRLFPRAHEAIRKNDLANFSKVFGRAALCDWGNEAGLAALKAGLPKSTRNITSEITLDQQGHLTQARFVGFWAYYEQTHSLKLLDPARTLIAEGKIECHYGTETTRRESDLNRPLGYYTIKNCRIVSFEARTFPAPVPRAECGIFRQVL